jgi:hypothetical protein
MPSKRKITETCYLLRRSLALIDSLRHEPPALGTHRPPAAGARSDDWLRWLQASEHMLAIDQQVDPAHRSRAARFLSVLSHRHDLSVDTTVPSVQFEGMQFPLMLLRFEARRVLWPPRYGFLDDFLGDEQRRLDAYLWSFLFQACWSWSDCVLVRMWTAAGSHLRTRFTLTQTWAAANRLMRSLGELK